MPLAPDTDIYRVPALDDERLVRALIAQPNEDVRELLAEHCRHIGLDPLADGVHIGDELPDVDLIVVEPVSGEGKRLLDLHAAQGSTIPLVFVSVYPPASIAGSPAVAYLTLPCSRERFQAAVAKAL